MCQILKYFIERFWRNNPEIFILSRNWSFVRTYFIGIVYLSWNALYMYDLKMRERNIDTIKFPEQIKNYRHHFRDKPKDYISTSIFYTLMLMIMFKVSSFSLFAIDDLVISHIKCIFYYLLTHCQLWLGKKYLSFVFSIFT